jgi:hypothetical protein
MKFRKIVLNGICALVFTLCLVSPAWSIPNLQIYIPGATYDTASETWIINSYNYELWVIGAHYDVLDVKMALAVPESENGSIVVEWSDSNTLNPGEYGYGFSSVTLNESDFMSYEAYRALYDDPDPSKYAFDYGIPRDGDDKDVPGGGVFPSDFYEYLIGDLIIEDEEVQNYIPGDEFGDTAPGDIVKFDISVLGYSWVDIVAYDHVVLSNNKAKYVVTPYSHDGAGNPPEGGGGGGGEPVPEPATLLLVGAGLLGCAQLRRKFIN